MEKMTKEKALNEFESLLNDDANFNYSRKEFKEWLKDYEIELI